MKTIVFGAGLQGKAVIHDLMKSVEIDQIFAVDIDPLKLREYQDSAVYKKINCLVRDLSSEPEILDTIRFADADIVISMLPAHFGYIVAKAAVQAGVPFVSSSYTGNLVELDKPAKDKGITILPEMGFDPGIDLMLAGLAVKDLDVVEGLHSYVGGIPDESSANNPLKYKISWTLDGVLKSYKRPAKILKDGNIISVHPPELFAEPYVQTIEIPEIGSLEAYPNGDAVRYIPIFGFGKQLKYMGRFSLRWPGHCEKWKLFFELGFLDEHPLNFKGISISPHQFMVQLLSPRLQFQNHERDLAVLRVQAWGLKDGVNKNIVIDLIDYRDLSSGLFAMNRTVGFTASIGAQMILTQQIKKPGVLSPVRDLPIELVIKQLKSRGIEIIKR